MSDFDLITIQSKIIRKGGTIVELQGGTYHFTPNAAGDHVAQVSDPDDVATLLAIKEGYCIYRAKPAPVAAAATAPAPVAPVVQPETKKAANTTKKAAKAEEKPADSMGLPPAGEADDLAALDRPALVEVFRAEVGREPSEHAEAEVLIAQIMEKRAEG